MSPALRTVTSVIVGILGLAVLAVIVSSRANTTGVINAASDALNSGIRAATSSL